MIDKFLSYINDKKLIIEGTPTLLAVSGGKDSMVMSDLFLRAGITFGIGHIQHHLRGQESEEDALFVEDYACKNGIKFYRYDIDPNVFTSGNMHHIARDLRYEWLRKITLSHGYGQIATAHHKDDWRETFIIQLLRGSGLDGLSSIQPKNQNIIRPLLWITRKEIDHYAKDHKIAFREDSSNAKDDYLRNQIRHHIMPSLRSIDDRDFKGLDTSIGNLAETTDLFYWLIEKSKKEYIVQAEPTVIVLLDKIKDTEKDVSLLFYILRDFGYNIDQTIDILKSEQGSIFYSQSHEAIIHQGQLVIKTKETTDITTTKHFESLEALLENDGHISFELLEKNTVSVFEGKNLYLDLSKIHFPVILRSRKNGDKYTPLGMSGKSQKIKDLLINKKLSQFEKNQVIVLEDSQKIIAVSPIGISDDVKITKNTQRVLCIKK